MLEFVKNTLEDGVNYYVAYTVEDNQRTAIAKWNKNKDEFSNLQIVIPYSQVTQLKQFDSRKFLGM